ncbi:hypothetical protein DNTS_001753 [Danionella cerebrum]|uniref:Uncharacterized protein n=1 Tax=Danionella cerebrum TaxID=2873325 RepID=A0A553MRV3_9TELE|nr:hypothetical protein DNTS_001753 [Danionella translucida]
MYTDTKVPPPTPASLSPSLPHLRVEAGEAVHPLHQSKSAEMSDQAASLLDGAPLIAAARQGKLRLARLLLDGGANVNERDHRGETALLAACRSLRGDATDTESFKVMVYPKKNILLSGLSLLAAQVHPQNICSRRDLQRFKAPETQRERSIESIQTML